MGDRWGAATAPKKNIIKSHLKTVFKKKMQRKFDKQQRKAAVNFLIF